KRQERDAARIVQAAGVEATQTNDPEKEVLAKVDAKFAPKYVELEKKWAEREQAQNGDPAMLRRMEDEQAEMATAQQLIANAVTDLEYYQHFLVRVGLGTLVISVLLTCLLFLYLGMRQLSRGRSAAGFFVVGAVVLLCLFVGSLAGTFFLMGG